jgi:predicted peptidase
MQIPKNLADYLYIPSAMADGRKFLLILQDNSQLFLGRERNISLYDYQAVYKLDTKESTDKELTYRLHKIKNLKGIISPPAPQRGEIGFHE